MERGVEAQLRLGLRREVEVGGGEVLGVVRGGGGGGQEEVRVGRGAAGQVGELGAAEEGEAVGEVGFERGEEGGWDGCWGVDYGGLHGGCSRTGADDGVYSEGFIVLGFQVRTSEEMHRGLPFLTVYLRSL